MALQLVTSPPGPGDPLGRIRIANVDGVLVKVVYDPDTADPATCCYKIGRRCETGCPSPYPGIGARRLIGDIDYSKQYRGGEFGDGELIYFVESDPSYIGPCSDPMVESEDECERPECVPEPELCELPSGLQATYTVSGHIALGPIYGNAEGDFSVTVTGTAGVWTVTTVIFLIQGGTPNPYTAAIDLTFFQTPEGECAWRITVALNGVGGNAQAEFENPTSPIGSYTQSAVSGNFASITFAAVSS